MLAALPEAFVNRRRSYWRLATAVVQTADHTREHLTQITAASTPAETAAPAGAVEPAPDTVAVP